jgi:tRNA (guanine-N7-)-methyltransferase
MTAGRIARTPTQRSRGARCSAWLRSHPVSTPTQAPRAIRSFVTRAGRTTLAQQRALDELWPRFGIEFSDAPLDLGSSFGRLAPCSLEIGFGNGEHLLAQALRRPECNFVGVEVHRPGIGRLLLGVEAQGLSNVRLICHDAVEVLERQVTAGSLDEIVILFPDPWPKKRHHKRRLLQPPFAERLALCLKPAGVLRLATDWEPYALQMLETLQGVRTLANLAPAGAFLEGVSLRAPTRFERRGERLGHKVWDLAFARR